MNETDPLPTILVVEEDDEVRPVLSQNQCFTLHNLCMRGLTPYQLANQTILNATLDSYAN